MRDGLTGCPEELERRGLLPDDPLCVLCVGSVPRGWANDMSDVDLCVVTRAPAAGKDLRTMPVPLSPDTVPTTTLHVDGRRWEVKYWVDAQVDQMLAKVSWAHFEADTTTRVLSVMEELFLERLMTAWAFSGEEWLTARREQLGESAFGAFATTRSLAEADDAVEDALGQLMAGDVDSAVLSARKALGHAVDAAMESNGNYGSRTPKWRARRFHEDPPAQITFEEYWELETMRDFDPTAPDKWVHTVMTRSKDLILDVEIR
jgi:hypothetical protein